MAEEELNLDEKRRLVRDLLAIDEQRNSILRQLNRGTDDLNKSTNKLQSSVDKTTKSFGTVYDALLNFVNRTATEAKEPIEVGMDFIKTSLDTGTKILEGLSNGASVFGSFSEAIAKTGLLNKIEEFGKGLASALGTTSSTIGDAFNLLAGQVMQNYNAFQYIQKSNILLGNGITELTQAAASAGVPLKAYSKGLNLARLDLQNMGIGAGEAGQRLSSVMGTVTRSSERYNIQLEALGYGTEEQMALMAQQMALDRASGLDKSKNDKQVAASAVQLAKDMKVLADVTGEDAKKKMDEARKESLRASIMANMSAEESAKFIQAFGSVPKEMQQTVLEYFASGGQVVTNAAGAMMQATNSQFDKTLKEMYAGVKNQNLTGEQLQDMTLANVRATAEEQRRMNREDGTAAAADRAVILGKIGGPVQDFTNLANSFSQNMIGQVEESRKRAEQAANLEKMDPVTRLAAEMKAFGEVVQRETQNIINAPLKNFTDGVNAFSGVLAKATENARVRADLQLGLPVLRSPNLPGQDLRPVPNLPPLSERPAANAQRPASATNPNLPPLSVPTEQKQVPKLPPLSVPTEQRQVPMLPPLSVPTEQRQVPMLPPLSGNTTNLLPKVSLSTFDKPMPVSIQNAESIASALKENAERPVVSAEDKLFHNDMRTLLTEQNSLLKTNINLAKGMLDGIGDVYTRLNNQRA